MTPKNKHAQPYTSIKKNQIGQNCGGEVHEADDCITEPRSPNVWEGHLTGSSDYEIEKKERSDK